MLPGGASVRGGASLGAPPQSSPTVSRLASEFHASDLISAVIRKHNRQDFTGAALPSGASVDSHALSNTTVQWEPGEQTVHKAVEHGLSPAGRRPAQLEADKVLRSWLSEAGLRVMPNSGRGNLCLVQSMLQRAGVSPEDLDEQAFQVQGALAQPLDALGRALREGQSLPADRQVLQTLAEHIFGMGNVPPVLIMTAGEHGMPLLHAPLADHAGAAVDPATLRHDTAVFLATSGHFEAVANTSGRPWSAVLRQTQTALGQPLEARRAALLRDAVRAVQPMRVETVDAAGVVHTHQWKRGVQSRLTVLGGGGQAIDPLTQAHEMAEAQLVLDDLWATLAQWTAFDLGQTPLDGGGRVHQLGVSPLGGYQEALSRDRQGQVNLPHIEPQESAFQYTAELRLRQDRVIGLTLRTSGEGDIKVEFDHPWSRSQSTAVAARARLTHADDLDAFDEFAPWALATGKRRHLLYFALFLLHLRRRGMEWEEFRNRPERARDRYLRKEVSDGQLDTNTSPAVQRAIDLQFTPQPPKPRPAPAYLTHEDDLRAFDEFAARACQAGTRHHPSCFAKCLQYLRERGTAWEEFRKLSEEERYQILHKAVRDGDLDRNTPSVVRRAIDPQFTVRRRKGPPVPPYLTHEDDSRAYKKFAAWALEAGKRQDPSCFALCLRHLRQHGIAWDEFRNRPEDDRERYLRKKVADRHLHRNTPSVVRRAIQLPVQAGDDE